MGVRERQVRFIGGTFAMLVAVLLSAAGMPARVTAAAPAVAADAPSVTVNEQTLAQMDGTWSDADGDPVELTPSSGSLDITPGTWHWSAPPGDGPSSTTITITADDGVSPPSQATFDVHVTNLPPSAITSGPAYVPSSSVAPRRFFWGASDVPSDVVTSAFHCGASPPVAEGAYHIQGVFWADCIIGSPGPLMVGVVAHDDDAGTTDARIAVTASPQIVSTADGSIRISGADDEHHLGWALAVADISGDGQADLLIGGGTRDTLPTLPGPGFVQVVLNRSTGLVADSDSIPAGAGFKILAADASDQLGRSISPAGDVNGDGLDDVIIGARHASPFGRTMAGAAYVVLGSTATTDVDLATFGPARGFRIAGDGSFRAAWAVAGVGDVNGDGFDDVALGSPAAQPSGRVGAGTVHVIFGSASPVDIDLANPPNAYGFEIDGQAGAYAGRSLAGGDINGDGLGDVVLGTHTSTGKVWVVYGSASPATTDLATLSSAQGFWIVGAGSNAYFGSSLAVGDVDGDGFDDVVAGSPGWNPTDNVNFNVGAAFIVRGGASNTNISGMAQYDGTRIFRIRGALDGEQAGFTVAAGDWTADGRADVLIGGPFSEPHGDVSGSAWVINGQAQLQSVDLGDLAAGWQRIDGSVETMTGVGLAIGDLTGDGIGDLVVGSPGYQMFGFGLASAFPGTDVAPPMVTDLRHGYRVGSTVLNGLVPIRLAWTGSDATSGIDHYEAALSTDGGSYVSLGFNLGGAGANANLAPWHTYQLRVRGTDNAGNTSAWSYGAAFRLQAIQDTSSIPVWSAGWTTGATAAYWGGTMRSGTTQGTKVSVTVTARAFGWVGAVGPTRGQANVYVDGAFVQTVNLYAPVGGARRVVFSKTWLSKGTHTVEIRIVGTLGHPQADVDAFVVGS